MKNLVTLCIALGFLALSAGAQAGTTCYKINEMGYRIKGAYAACFHVRWKAQDGNTYVLGNHDLDGNCPGSAGDTQVNINLSKLKLDEDAIAPVEGDEVWGQYQIDVGESKNCHNKEDRKFFYYGDGGKVVYWSRGTVTEDNGCKVRQPDSKYKIPCP